MLLPDKTSPEEELRKMPYALFVIVVSFKVTLLTLVKENPSSLEA
jgi:hypothetical protein